MNGNTDHAADEKLQETFTALGKLEEDFAAVELDALRQKEYALRNAYKQRHELTAQIPQFWPTVLDAAANTSEPEDPLNLLEDDIIPYIRSLQVERYQIESEKIGEPRSLRFIFEFEKNEWFEDTRQVKDFEFRKDLGGVGAYVSEPVTFKWTKAGKSAGRSKLLDAACDLYKAEQALQSKSKIGVDQSERESLWQYEKLDEAIAKSQEEGDGEMSFLDWFGYRGAVNLTADRGKAADVDQDVGEDDDGGMLDVEIFPAGEDLALALAEELWPNVMDVFVSANAEDDFEEIEEEGDDDDAPELVGESEKEIESTRPKKRQRTG